MNEPNDGTRMQAATTVEPTGPEQPGVDWAELLIDGDHILPALLDDIAKAERSIHLAIFLFFDDPIGDRVTEALIEARRRGVVVRVLLNVEKTAMGDPFSSGERQMMKHDPHVNHDPCDVKGLCRRMRAAGLEVFDSNIDYERLPRTDDPRLRSIAAQIKDTVDISALHVDHRKIVIIDGCLAYCGGANVGAQYLFRDAFDPTRDAYAEGAEGKAADHPEPWWKWHDSLTRFYGPIAGEIEKHFRTRWILDGGSAYDLTEGAPAGCEGERGVRARGFRVRHARILSNAPNDEPNEVRMAYLDLIGAAARSIFIENPYLYHPEIVNALVHAKERHGDALDVDLVLPSRRWNDNEFAHDAQQHHYTRYVACGIRVHEYQNHFNHLKMAVIDGRYSIHGSTNLNFRSLDDDKDFELVVLVDDEALAADVLARVRDVDIPRCQLITREQVEHGLTGMRIRMRDPRTLLLASRRLL